MNPLAIYQQKLNEGQIKEDTLQNEVVLAFDSLYQQLKAPKPAWYLRPFVNTDEYPKGIYIYGSVGRGKTFLMDLFVSTIPEKIVRRQHFHAFMLWFHQQLHGIKNQQNPVEIIIKKLSSEIKVLCLDEFLVHDITDAMILTSILQTAEKYRIKLVTTSNIDPIDLYHGGLQRKKFLPAIEWIQNNMSVLKLDGAHDYRTAHKITEKKWLCPIKDHQDYFEQTFSHLVANNTLHISPITINKRPMNVIKRSEHHIMFEFETLCKQARSASDYIALCEQYQSISIVINSAIEDDDRNTAKRFITLIDVMYDTQTPLYVLSQVDYIDIYKGKDFAFEMQRTHSRLTEMQS